MRVWALFSCDDLSMEGSAEGLICLHATWEGALECWANGWLEGTEIYYAWVEERENVWTLYQDNDEDWRELTIYPIEVEN